MGSLDYLNRGLGMAENMSERSIRGDLGRDGLGSAIPFSALSNGEGGLAA